MTDKDYLKDYFSRRGSPEKADPYTKQSIAHDKWDHIDYNNTLKEIPDFKVADYKLTKAVPRTGTAAMGDTFFSLLKVKPQLKGPNEVRPSYLVNRAVIEAAHELKEMEELRAFSVGDKISAGLACYTMEPEIEALFDRLKEEQGRADQLEQALNQYGELAEKETTMQDLIDELEREQNPENSDKIQDYQSQQELIEQQMQQLQNEIMGESQGLQQDLKTAKSDIQSGVRQALRDALDDTSNSEQFSMLWGTDKGGLKKLPVEQRLNIAERMKTEKFKKLAQIIGPMLYLAFAQQKRKVPKAHEEVFDTKLGSDLSMMLASEWINLVDDDLYLDFLIRLSEGSLREYELKGEDKVARGAIIFIEDGSGSMSGPPEIWAKAVGLALLMIAKMQKRPFYGIHFGGTNEYKTFDFHTAEGGDGSCTTTYEGKTEELDPIEAVLQFAEIYFGSGTDFVSPLTLAMNKLEKQYEQEGAVKGDIVFVTDGICGVPKDWLENFCERRDALAVKVYSIVIGGDCMASPIPEISGPTPPRTPSDFISGNELADVYNVV